MRPDKTKMSEFGAERGSLQGHARRRVASTLKDPQLLESFQQSSFIGKGGVVSCCKFLGVRSFVLKVRSLSAHDVCQNLHNRNVIFCSDKKGKIPKPQLSLSEVQALCKRRGSRMGWLPCPEPSSSTQSRFSHPCPGPDKEADFS